MGKVLAGKLFTGRVNIVRKTYQILNRILVAPVYFD